MATGRPVTGPRIIVALDYSDAEQALNLVRQLDPARCRLKVGKELFTRAGPELVRRLVGAGFDVFLDLKFHDIPNTVAGACRAAADLGVWMVNVHALGGATMMRAARDAVAGSRHRPMLTAVTVLTSLGGDDLAAIGLGGSPEENVLRLARLANASGLDGVVCSAREAEVLRTRVGAGFLLVTPGIRPVGTDVGDQKRIVTPRDAIRAGADYLVIGRPITQADDPMGVLLRVNSEIGSIARSG